MRWFERGPDMVHNEKGIYGFFGDYRWLSNFHEAWIKYDGILYRSTENAYQAAKTLDINQRQMMADQTPSMVKKIGRNGIVLRDDWNDNLWDRVWNYDQFVKAIKRKGLPDRVSFDHDLADEHYAMVGETSYKKFKEKTGFHCMQFMIEYMIENNLPPPRVYVHSMNPVGRENIAILFNNFLKHFKWDNSKEFAILTGR